jgi:exopolysaccharide biosynthesis protein
MAADPNATVWSCTQLVSLQLAPGALWQQLNCSSSAVPVFGPAGPVIVNLVTADLSRPGLRLVPVTAPRNVSVTPLNSMAASDGRNLLAGINGGYFYRVDLSSFFDTVCICKTNETALQPPAAGSPDTGVGDGATVADGVLLASSCDCICCFNRPTTVTINGTATRIDVQSAGDLPPAGLTLDSLTAGPNLVSSNASGSFIDIPSDDLNIGNIYEHSSNTAFGLSGNGTAYLVTFDGYDGCPSSNSSCGTNAFTMAYFLRDYLGVSQGMGMDQGGSTTMYVAGQGEAGIVSNPGSGPRPIFNGLFLLQE